MSKTIQRIAVPTADGSTTLYIPQWDEHYHSVHGAVQESNHVFIHAGLLFYLESNANKSPIHILEIGLGTGLNALLTAKIAAEKKCSIHYTALEAYPLSDAEINLLDFSSAAGISDDTILKNIHASVWEQEEKINDCMQLCKHAKKLEDWQPSQSYDIIYFDAFAPSVQPELWNDAIFQKLFEASCSGTVLITYCVKGAVRRAMQAAGWQVKKIPGPPGKREMTRAIRP